MRVILYLCKRIGCVETIALFSRHEVQPASGEAKPGRVEAWWGQVMRGDFIIAASGFRVVWRTSQAKDRGKNPVEERTEED